MPNRIAMSRSALVRRFPFSLPAVLLLLLLGVLLLAGGASRGDVAGQVVVRTVAWGALIVAILFCQAPAFGSARPVLGLLLALAGLCALQLVPLPPMLWQAMPGHAILSEAAAASDQVQPWRPWTMVPGATLNALASLIVPFTVLILACSMSAAELEWLPGVALTMIVAVMFVGLLQFSGVNVYNPLVNASDEVSGTFANRNHFALMLAIGCAIAPVWATLNDGRGRWRGPLAAGLVVLFALSILASGSRAGMALGALAIATGIVTVSDDIRRAMRRYPRWAPLAIAGGAMGAGGLLVASAVSAGRALAVTRALATDLGQDMRSQGLPTVTAMVREYFPFGGGIGGFDTLFRMHEPLRLLDPEYFNHAHDDLLEVLLDAGAPGGVLLFATLSWLILASWRAWRAPQGARRRRACLGSAIVFLTIGASLFDYPARTPTIMAMLVIAGLWLSDIASAGRTSALPISNHHL